VSFTNPIVPGFHPDPSVCRVGDTYYLACSSFEYLPGIPVFRSPDLQDWTLVGHVATRPGQLDPRETPTGGGAWAPTLRHHDGLFHLIITEAMGGRGTVLFTAGDPAGPWSDGVVLDGLSGIDPDIAWTADGTCYVTFSGLQLDLSAGDFRHLGIQQVRIDPASGKLLEEPRSLWSGTGGMFPEAPHLYEIDGAWYLMIAEGGTERGHSVTIARGPSPAGPFTGCPHNPLVTARGTANPVQNTGHGDLVRRPDGSWAMVLLGTRPRSLTRAFAPMGRETFATGVRWQDGWPLVDPVTLADPVRPQATEERFDAAPLGPDWVAVRRFPVEVADLAARPGWLRLTADGSTMDDPRPVFVGRRQEREQAEFEATVDVTAGIGGLAMRYDERFHVEVEAGGGRVRARVTLPTLTRKWSAPLPGNVVDLRIVADPQQTTCDLLFLGFREDGGDWQELAAIDGRFLSSDMAESFTGRVAGVYAVAGVVDVERFAVTGKDLHR
jgi:xylan 1,4-beta-xylosidase